MIILYFIFGYISIGYLKRNLLGIRAEFTTSVSKFMWDKFLWGVILGWITIPLMVVVWVFRLFFH